MESLLAGLMGTTVSLLVDSLARAERRFHLRMLLEGPSWLVHAVPEVVTGTREAVERRPGTRVGFLAVYHRWQDGSPVAALAAGWVAFALVAVALHAVTRVGVVHSRTGATATG